MANKLQNTAKLVKKIVHNEKYTELEFELDGGFTCPFKSGQYVSIKVAQPNVLRSYSICSNPSDQSRFKLMVDVTPKGLGTTYLQSLHQGDAVEILGPLGKFVLSEGIEDKNVVLIGTGSGVAPLISMLQDLTLNIQTTQQVLLLWGERYAKDLILQRELYQMIEGKENIRLIDVISKPTEGEGNYHGRVTDYIKNEVLPDNAEYYLCGRKEMINDVIELLKGRGIEESPIFYEKFD